MKNKKDSYMKTDDEMELLKVALQCKVFTHVYCRSSGFRNSTTKSKKNTIIITDELTWSVAVIKGDPSLHIAFKTAIGMCKSPTLVTWSTLT